MSNSERKRGLARQQQDALSVWDRVNVEAEAACAARDAAWVAHNAAEDRISEQVRPDPILLAYDHREGRRWGYHLVHPDHVRADYRSLVLGDATWEAEALAAVEDYRKAVADANQREGVAALWQACEAASKAANAAIDRALSTPAPDAKSISEKMRWLSVVLPDVSSLTDLAAIGMALESPDGNRETLAFLSVYFDLLRMAGEGERIPAFLAEATDALNAQRADYRREEAREAATQFDLNDGWHASAWIAAWEAEGGSFARAPANAFSYVQPDPLTAKAETLLSELDRDPSRRAAIRWLVSERQGWPQKDAPVRFSALAADRVRAEAISAELMQLAATADRLRAAHAAAVTAADHPPTERQPSEEEKRAVRDACAAMGHAHAELLNYVPRNPRELAYKAAAVERAWQLIADEDADSYAYLIARDARAAAGEGEGA